MVQFAGAPPKSLALDLSEQKNWHAHFWQISKVNRCIAYIQKNLSEWQTLELIDCTCAVFSLRCFEKRKKTDICQYSSSTSLMLRAFSKNKSIESWQDLPHVKARFCTSVRNYKKKSISLYFSDNCRSFFYCSYCDF